jgi:hypothetical protein
MRKEVVDYMAKCSICQQVQVEHRKPVGLLQPLPIPKWKWEMITMDFVLGLPRRKRGNDTIWVIVDRLSLPFSYLSHVPHATSMVIFCSFAWFGSCHLVFDWRLLGSPNVLVFVGDSRVRDWLWLGKVLAPLVHPTWGKLLRDFDVN